MINKRYILLILSTLAFVINTMAQAAEEDCYGDNRTKGISSYNSGKYAEAKKYFQSAQNCDMKPKQNDIARWIDNCNKKINEQKQAQTPKQQTQIAPEMQPVQVYAEQGALYGVFSVSPTKKVRFSQGNLQYRASTNTWRFAEHQYDMIGKANKNISSTYAGWIDLFGWGTSGYNGKFPYMTSTEPTNYGNGSSDITGTNYDWGVYNKISNGGNQAGFWRTLTYIEWNYLINSRINAKIKYGVACVNGVDGLIFCPIIGRCQAD